MQSTGPKETNEETFENWRILTNLWVAINPQTGAVSVSENADTPNLGAFASGPNTRA